MNRSQTSHDTGRIEALRSPSAQCRQSLPIVSFKLDAARTTVAGSSRMRHTNLARKLRLDSSIEGTVSDVFTALGRTLAFRRWPAAVEVERGCMPLPGCRYRYQAGPVLRVGRVVEVIRPVAVTLKEILHDPPCRVSLTMRWRIDPGPTGCVVRLRAEYRLNHASVLRARHWEHRLSAYFCKQLHFLALNLGRSLESPAFANKSDGKRDLMQH